MFVYHELLKCYMYWNVGLLPKINILYMRIYIYIYIYIYSINNGEDFTKIVVERLHFITCFIVCKVFI